MSTILGLELPYQDICLKNPLNGHQMDLIIYHCIKFVLTIYPTHLVLLVTRITNNRGGSAVD